MGNTAKFVHKISKGGRYMQVYVPKEKEQEFGVGDLVEVKLLEKRVKLYYSPNLPKLIEFKEQMIRSIFSILAEFSDIQQVFIIGSFLVKHVDYNDIDILVVSSSLDKNIEKNIYSEVTVKYPLRFHMLVISPDKFNNLLHICPVTRGMLSNYVSSKPFTPPSKIEIDKNHILFLLMMPEDILDVSVESRVYYDNLRRLIVIERFLKNKKLNFQDIDGEINHLLGSSMRPILEKNELLAKEDVSSIRSKIQKKIFIIERMLKDEQI